MLRRDCKSFAFFAGGSQSTGRQSPVLEFRRPQPQSTRIQAFTHDDFSDIEDDWNALDKSCEMLSVNYVTVKLINYDETMRDLRYDDRELI